MDGPPAIRFGYDSTAVDWTFGFEGTSTLDIRYAIECGELAMLSNEYTVTISGSSVTWISSEVASRQCDGTRKYVLDNPYAAPVPTI
jgi:hypothetical protein